MSRTRLGLTVLVAAAAAGLAAGLVLARGSSASVRTGAIASGRFVSVGWETKGTATIAGRADGSAVLRLTGFRTQPAPELWVVLEGKQGTSSRRQLSPLRSAEGNQVYSIPTAFALHPPARVLIYCAKCGRMWGYAQLSAARSAST